MYKCFAPGISPGNSVGRKFVPTVSFARDAGGPDPDEREVFKSACKRPTHPRRSRPTTQARLSEFQSLADASLMLVSRNLELVESTGAKAGRSYCG